MSDSTANVDQLSLSGHSPTASVLTVPNNSEPENPETALIHFKMLEALRTENIEQIQELWTNWPKAKETGYTAPLHLSVLSSGLQVNKAVLALPDLDINQQDSLGNTALHQASKAGRLAIVKLLLESPNINDFLDNKAGRNIVDVAKTNDVIQLIHDNRKQFIVDRTVFLEAHLSQPTQQNLSQIVQFFTTHPRHSLLDVNHRHPLTGYTALHLATLLDDPTQVSKLLSVGANAFARDRKGKTSIDLAKSDQVKSMLKNSNANLTINEPGHAPRMEGILKKWTNLAGGNKNRWFVLENGILSYYKSREDTANACRGSINVVNAHLKLDSNDPCKFDVIGKDSTRFHLRANTLSEAKQWILGITSAKSQQNPALRNEHLGTVNLDKRLSTNESPISMQSPSLDRLFNLSNNGKTSPTNLDRERPNSIHSEESDIPNRDTIDMTQHSTSVQFDILEKLLGSLKSSLSKDPPDTAETNRLLTAISDCRLTLNSSHQKLIDMYQQRENYWQRKYQKEADHNDLWSESLRTLAMENQSILDALEKSKSTEAPLDKSTKSTNNGDLVADTTQTVLNSHQQAAPEPIGPSFDDDDDDIFYDAEDASEFFVAEDDTVQDEPIEDEAEQSQQVQRSVSKSNTTSPIKVALSKSYQGYPTEGKFRTNLQYFKDGAKPPSISLWAILKNSIGKDLTKITLPVFFNEPSSMLQRMSEDMEYSRLLDIASRQTGSAERTMWVTAFAMSNYSSTAGRIAKPFNPLLGETFEYCRPDLGYRYISEQVSHHPPISACYCESPNYVLATEVNVKSAFWGKSFDLMPQGVCHVFLKVHADKKEGSEIPVEHISWKKVTTSVTNLILGNPTIEHYGEMIVTNHNTGDVCTLTFKSNGWLSSDRNVLEGQVTNAKSGKVEWVLSGAWDKSLVAKRSGVKNASQSLEAHLESTSSKLSEFLKDPTSSDSVTLWKRSPFPEKPLPFKLTPFAITLNEMPDDLKPLLPHTDCRLRPDQRAMEEIRFDDASDEKNRLEEKQRGVRKAKEANLQMALQNAPPSEHATIKASFAHKPRWFKRATEPTTNEEWWEFTQEYWLERERVAQELAKGSTHATWKDVPDIF